jgi:RDD family
MTKDSNKDFRISTPLLIVRQKSVMIDGITIILLMYLATALLEKLSLDSSWIRIVLFSLIVLYEPIAVTINRTIGQAIMGIHVRSFKELEAHNTLKNINFFASLLRYFIKISLGIISFVTMKSDPYNRAIHDKIADSVMLYE